MEARLSTLSNPGEDSNRPEIWSTAVEIAVDNPAVGIGVNQFEAEASQRGLTEFGVPLENAHSIQLSFAAETGVIGLAAFLALVVQLAARAVRAMRSRGSLSRPLALGLSGALLAFMVQGLTATQLRTHLLAGIFFIFAGMLTGLADRAGDSSRPERETRPAGGPARPTG